MLLVAVYLDLINLIRARESVKIVVQVVCVHTRT